MAVPLVMEESMVEEAEDDQLEQAYKYWHDLGFDEGYEVGYEDGLSAASAKKDDDEGRAQAVPVLRWCGNNQAPVHCT